MLLQVVLPGFLQLPLFNLFAGEGVDGAATTAGHKIRSLASSDLVKATYFSKMMIVTK